MTNNEIRLFEMVVRLSDAIADYIKEAYAEGSINPMMALRHFNVLPEAAALRNEIAEEYLNSVKSTEQ